MTSAAPQPTPQVRQVSPEEGYEMFDALTREHVHMSADEFIERWRAGEYEFDVSPELDDLLFLLPMALHRDDA